MITISTICDIIILVGGLVVAVTNIMKFFGKPIKIFKKRKDKEYSEVLKENLDKLVPQYLENHDLETRDKYLADRQRYLQEISSEVYKRVEDDIKEIKENSNQYKEVITLL